MASTDKTAPTGRTVPQEEASTAHEASTARQYPISPAPADDPRFTFGLAKDVADVLATHGYPEITSGLDFVDLQQALFRFLYGPPPAGGDPAVA